MLIGAVVDVQSFNWDKGVGVAELSSFKGMALLPISLKGCRLNPYGVLLIGSLIISGHIMLICLSAVASVF